MENKRLKIAIVGGGIGGLSLALSITKFVPDYDSHLEIDVYESTSSLEAQVGAGIGVWPVTWGIFERWGIDKKFAECGMGTITEEPSDLSLFRKADRPEGRNIFRIKSTCGEVIFFHRADFQQVLLDSVPPSIRIHTKKRLRGYVQSERGAELQFEDGTGTYANLVIGADGLQSRVRKTLIDEISPRDASLDAKRLADPSWTGTIGYRCIIPRQRFIDAGWPNHRALADWTFHSGKRACIMSYPLRGGESINFLGLRFWPEYEGVPFSQELFDRLLEKEGYTRPPAEMEPAGPQESSGSNEHDPWADNGGGGRLTASRSRWVRKADAQEVKHSFLGFEPEVQALTAGVDSALAWAIHRVGPLKTYVNGNVCLLGDAAHAMPPQQGSGAGQAILDGYVLAHLLASVVATNPLNISSQLRDALQAYNTVRRTAAETVCASSRANAFHYCGYIQEGDGDESWRELDVDNDDEVKLLQDRMTRRWLYAWDKGGADKEAEKAVQILKERIGVL